MTSLWCRWFGLRCPKPKPLLGVVCHRLNADDLAALATMHIRAVRLSLYPDGTNADQIDTAVAHGLDALVVSFRSPADRITDRRRWPAVRWQYGNEPDWATTTPQAAALLATGTDVSPGVAHGTPLVWMQAFSSALLPNTAPLAVHCYGSSLVAAVRPTILEAKASAGLRAIWITELGVVQDAQDLSAALEATRGQGIARVYVYALWSPDDAYTLTPAQQQVIAGWML